MQVSAPSANTNVLRTFIRKKPSATAASAAAIVSKSSNVRLPVMAASPDAKIRTRRGAGNRPRLPGD